MATVKSPFIVIPEFISPLQCEEIINDLQYGDPDVDVDGNPIKMSRHNEKHEEDLYYRMQAVIPQVCTHYNSVYRATEKMQFEYLAQGVVTEPECANSQYLRKKWVKTKDRDITGFLFLTDYSNDENFDPRSEVYGGKLEFPQHKFSFMPERGTLVLFPSVPHFLYANSAIIAGDMFQVKMNFATAEPLLYQPDDYPGDYTSWLKDFL